MNALHGEFDHVRTRTQSMQSVTYNGALAAVEQLVLLSLQGLRLHEHFQPELARKLLHVRRLGHDDLVLQLCEGVNVRCVRIQGVFRPEMRTPI